MERRRHQDASAVESQWVKCRSENEKRGKIPSARLSDTTSETELNISISHLCIRNQGIDGVWHEDHFICCTCHLMEVKHKILMQLQQNTNVFAFVTQSRLKSWDV